jgi:adenine-specific DNA-methyltransferase
MMPRKPSRKRTLGGKAGKVTPVESLKHKDARVNIPTHELRDFVKEDEAAPKTLLYPRDPSLDPQLVWKGKDEQDRQDLAVPVVPIYIQEKIHPQALIENLRDTAKPGESEPELSLFADFNGIVDFEKKVDFYRHDAHWSNRMILGDSVLVMASLAEKEGLKGKVQCIYFDPPYGIKFGSNWQISTRAREVKDGRVEDATRQPEQVRAFRDTWTLGIHSYLAYLRDRLVAAHSLLTESGSLFVQMGEDNLHLVRCVLDEVFGSVNAVVTIVVKKKGATTPTDPVNDFLLWYARDRSRLKIRRIYEERSSPTEDPKFNTIVGPDGSSRRAKGLTHQQVQSLLNDGWRWARVNYPIVSQHFHKSRSRDYVFRGQVKKCGKNMQWRFEVPDGLDRLVLTNRLYDAGGESLGGVVFWNDWPFVALSNIWDDLKGEENPVYVVQTAWRVLQRCIMITTDPGDLVLDPTCGSGTTAFVAEQWGRRWITVDTSRVALALARTRLMTARYPYYVLADSLEGLDKEAAITGNVPPQHKTDGDIRKGFVYKRVPHVTLKSIANNPDIKEGMTPKEIEAAIARYADTEILYDQPYEDSRRIRVTGPFTVESLSPHRVLAPDDLPKTEANGRRDSAPAQFETMIIENLHKAGVQNTKKGERLEFESLDLHAGSWIHAAGTYLEGGKPRRVAVSIGPEHGTVGPQQVKEAAKEAVQGVGYDTLIVAGFAFDPHVSEEVKRYGKLTVLPVRMNPDLSMGDELLKKTGAGNLFMVFGEPDVDVRKDKDGQITIEIRGLDVYDPTTGEIRSSSTDDIACWFIDTNYNEESFFVRHAYFTGSDAPYQKLQRALRAEIDEAAWQSLYRTVSRPFTPPETGKIAVKVINHYGDEVLKVFAV